MKGNSLPDCKHLRVKVSLSLFYGTLYNTWHGTMPRWHSKIWFKCSPVIVNNDDESYLMTNNYAMTDDMCNNTIYHQLICKQPQPAKINY